MNPDEIRNFLAQGLELMGLRLSNPEQVLDRLALYFQELKKWNRKVNLVARTLDDRQVLENHFLDSLSLLSIQEPANISSETVLDVGTGAGFPGLVLKVACPMFSVTLVEPRKNRFYFLRHIVRTLTINDVELLNGRLEETGESQELCGRQFTFITSRAFTDIDRFVRLTARYLAPGGRIVCMKGPGADKGLSDLFQNGIFESLQLAETRKLQLPFSRAERNLAIIKWSEI